MLRFNISLLLLLGALFAASSGAQVPSPSQTAEAPGDLANLLPEEALVYVQLESLERLEEISTTFYELTGSPLELDQLARDMIEAQIGSDQVDPTRPIGMTSDPSLILTGASPISALFLPAKDPSTLAGSLQTGEGRPQAETEGSYVAIPQVEGFTRGTGPSPLTRGLLPGAVSVRAELGTLLETFRPMIDAGLDQLAGMVSSFPGEVGTSAIELEDLFEIYIDGLGTVMDSADALDLALDFEGTEMNLAFEFLAEEGSQLATVVKDSKAGTTRLAGFLDPESDFLVFMNGGLGAFFEESLPMAEDFMSIYPEAVQSIFDTYLPKYIEMLHLCGDEIIMTQDWGSNGLSLEYFIAAEDTDELLASFRQMLQTELGRELGMSIGPLETTNMDGLEVTRSVVQVDYRKIASTFGAASEVDQDQTAKLIEDLYGGEELEVAFAASGGVLAIYGGAVGVGFEDTMKRLQAGPGKVHEDFEADIAALEKGRLGSFMRMDMAKMMLLPEADLEDPKGPQISVSQGRSATMEMDFMLVGRAWRGSMNMDLAAIAELLGR